MRKKSRFTCASRSGSTKHFRHGGIPQPPVPNQLRKLAHVLRSLRSHAVWIIGTDRQAWHGTARSGMERLGLARQGRHARDPRISKCAGLLSKNIWHYAASAFFLAQRTMTFLRAISEECALALPETRPTILPAERFTNSGLSS
jgi:hypothetical protein